MRSLLLTSVVVALTAGGAPTTASPDPSEAIFSVRVTRTDATSRASAVLLQRVDGTQGVTLYFVTTAHLFRHDERGLLPQAQSITVEGRPAITFDVDPRKVEVPRGTISDLALMQIVVPSSSLMPRQIAFTTPAAGALFFVGGRDREGRPVAILQHVTHRSTVRVLGDRELTEVDACGGAPAVSEAGIFGLVAHCEAGRGPEIALFEIARSWLSKRVPGLAEAQRTLTRFEAFRTPK